MQPRTSTTHPLRITEFQPDGFSGRLGITLCPGKQGDSVFGPPWKRDLEVDIDAILAWGARLILTLVESNELVMLGVPDLGARVRSRGIEWRHLPIPDLQEPGATFEEEWPAAAQRSRELIASGERVLIHCRGGLGRAGTVAACLLIELGTRPEEAIHQIRRARPHAIETPSQERYVRRFEAITARDHHAQGATDGLV